MSSRRRLLQPNAALAEMMARDFEDRPFGVAGEMARPERSAPAPPPPPFVIEPPPWIVQAHTEDPDRDPPEKESAA